jgi:hypothetical protein
MLICCHVLPCSWRCALQESLRIHKAEEKGRVAYKVGAELGQTERVSGAVAHGVALNTAADADCAN